jgi:hypothetical protein
MIRYTALSLALAFVLPAAAQSRDAALLPPARGDVVLRSLVRDAPASPATIERAPVRFAWALPADAGPIEAPAPYTATSREHWRDVDGATLARGLRLHTTAPGALVLISPAGPDSLAVARDALQVRQAGRVLAAGEATVALAPQAALEDATGTRFAPGALGFRLSPALGVGEIELQVTGAQGRYVVHVREPDSPVALHVDSPVPDYRTGAQVRLQARLDNTAGLADLREIGGVLTAPDGREIPLRGTRTRAGVVLEAALPATASRVPGLWEAHVLASGEADGQPVLRDAKVAFEVTAPTARLHGRHTVSRTADGQLSVDLPLDVGSAGRYEARAVLYGTGHDGRLAPVAVGHTADWLTPGARALTLVFPPDVISGSRAPYELRQLGLHDQGRMGRLEYRERAARIDTPTIRAR